jgi:hypothetical protein
MATAGWLGPSANRQGPLQGPLHGQPGEAEHIASLAAGQLAAALLSL